VRRRGHSTSTHHRPAQGCAVANQWFYKLNIKPMVFIKKKKKKEGILV
jgi:hypothetical protein